MISDASVFGALGDGTDATAALQAWLTNTATITGRGHIPAGTYLLSSTVSNVNLTQDIHVTVSRGAKFVSIQDMKTPMFNLAGPVSVEWEGGNYDFSNGIHIVGTQSSTCLAFSGLDTLNISRGRFFGAVDYRAETADSAITELATKHGTITQCDFVGFSDNAIYLSGGGSTGDEDDGRGFTVSESYFEKNAIACSSRRDRRGTKFVNNTCDGNGIDFFEVHIGTLGSAQRSIVSGMHSTNAGSRSINFRGSKGGIITENCIDDFGYDLDGNPVGVARGIMIEGSSENVIANNNIRMHSKATHGAHIGISFQEYDIDGDTRAAMDNAVNGNIISGMQWGVRSVITPQGSTPGPNYGRANIIRDTTYPLDVDGDVGSL